MGDSQATRMLLSRKGGLFIFLLLSWIFSSPLFADGGSPPASPPSAASNKSDSPSNSDEVITTPYTEYGEFNNPPGEEETNTIFFQFGRFFGVSLGLGSEFADGYRGTLWQGGFPLVDFKFHYWFDFNLAVDMGFSIATHFYDTKANNIGRVDVSMFHPYFELKYYFDTRNLGSAISFSNPYLIIGVGSFTKTENYLLLGQQDSNSGLGLSLGAGLEFVISPKKTYIEIEGKVHFVRFKDTYTTLFSSQGLPNLTGNLYTVNCNLLLTW
jgi:hypothetical protein